MSHAPDKRRRCEWVKNGNALYYQYHDNEWGVPVRDDTRHFEFLILEGMQAGLSWAVVLNKRENYRRDSPVLTRKKPLVLTKRRLTVCCKTPV